MKKLLSITTAFMFSAGLVLAQVNGITRCGTIAPPPEFEIWMQKKIAEMKNLKGLNVNAKITVVYTIPVIMHVINNGETVGVGTNLSAAQLNSQIDVLNEDFRKLNADWSKVAAGWQSLMADFEINFCKALVDSSGVTLAEPGIHRVNRNTMGWTAPPYLRSYIDGTIKPATIWDLNKYMNIWVCNLGSGLLGYAYFPYGSGLAGMSTIGTATTDGIVILYNAFGRVGNLGYPGIYDKGRTATHEIGHWLGLRHIWGDDGGTCANTDYCTDTPNQALENLNCWTQGTVITDACTTVAPGIMWMNYMDYTNDACMYSFTNDQKTRAQTAMTNGVYRAPLASSTVCDPLGITPQPTLESYINIYPNPTDGILNIDVTNFNAPEMILKIYDILGQLIINTTVSVGNVANGNYTVNFSAQQNGIYFVDISNGAEKITRKIILNK